MTSGKETYVTSISQSEHSEEGWFEIYDLIKTCEVLGSLELTVGYTPCIYFHFHCIQLKA